MIKTIKRFFLFKKKINFFEKKIIILGIILLFFIAQNITDKFARDVLQSNGGYTKSLISHFLQINIILNPGIAFNMFSNNIAAALAIETIFIVIVFSFWFFCSTKWLSLGLILITFGALGNITQHMVYGSAVDYIQVIPLHIIFNFSDIYITIGAIISFFAYIFSDSFTFSILKKEKDLRTIELRKAAFKKLDENKKTKQIVQKKLVEKYKLKKGKKNDTKNNL